MLIDGKVAIVYDWIDKIGGVERLLVVLHEIFPEAPFYTSYYDKQNAHWAADLKITTSFINQFPTLIKKNRILSLPFYPYAFESFDFSDFDLVISVTSAFAKGIITHPGTYHLNFLLTPTRYFWNEHNTYMNSRLVNRLAMPITTKMRCWDYVASTRPDSIISISQEVARRCLHYYQRNSQVIYPPFDEVYWQNIVKEGVRPAIPVLPKEYYLIVSRLEPYKKVDIAIQAFNTLADKQLIIVGKGTEKKKLAKIAGENILFLENINDSQLAFLYSHAKALIMPQEEEFGYVVLEAQFFGCPIIAYGKGGALETVISGKTGIFYEIPYPAELVKAIARFDIISYTLRSSTEKFGPKQAKLFSKEKFKKEVVEYIKRI